MKPILFNTQMVKAIIDGKKTVTRRCVKFPSYIIKQENGLYTLYADGTCYENQYFKDIQNYLKQPYKVGDILYVRETWNICNMDIEQPSITFIYKANESEGESANTIKVTQGVYDKYIDKMVEDNPQWKPSIHMPKEAARIFLKVMNVRMERLQHITNVDAEKEGAAPDNPLDFAPDKWPNKENFKIIWDSTIKNSEIGTYGWDANPWVWVIEFKRCNKPIE